MDSGREALMQAFDRLFARAADKLRVSYTAEELEVARANFEHRFAAGIEAINTLDIDTIPDEVLGEMEQAIADLSPAEVIGHLAAVPLIHKAQELLRQVSYRVAEKRVLEYAMEQADDRYGGN